MTDPEDPNKALTDAMTRLGRDAGEMLDTIRSLNNDDIDRNIIERLQLVASLATRIAASPADETTGHDLRNLGEDIGALDVPASDPVYGESRAEATLRVLHSSLKDQAKKARDAFAAIRPIDTDGPAGTPIPAPATTPTFRASPVCSTTSSPISTVWNRPLPKLPGSASSTI